MRAVSSRLFARNIVETQKKLRTWKLILEAKSWRSAFCGFMDNNLAENVQDVDDGNERDEAMDNCLRNPVIIRKIFEHISSMELLQISLVNKLWKFEARSVVKKRSSLIVQLKSDRHYDDSCERVGAFLSELPAMNAIPVSGISIRNSYLSHTCPRSAAALDPIFDGNFDQLSLKSVSVKLDGSWQWRMRKCPALLLAKKVLQQFCGVLEELELNISEGQGDYIKKVIHDRYFPRLKILKVSTRASNVDIENYMRVLLARAPNLKILYTNWNINEALPFLQGTSVELVYTTPVCAPFDVITENFIAAIRLENLHLAYTGPGFNFERFSRVAPVLLEASRGTTIRFLSVDAVFAVPLVCYGTRLENVKILWMNIDYRRMELVEPRVLSILKNFDFTRICPNLDQVCVFPNNGNYHGLPLEYINTFIERANAVLREPLLDRAARIKKLSLVSWHPSRHAAQFFLQMFPNIEQLKITHGSRRPIPFGSIWNWLDLNELEVDGNLLPATRNLDSVFLGIFPEEVAELRLKDDEYLKKVNIVPVRPAVTCLKNLRSLSLHHTHLGDSPFGDDAPMFIFSKVTALLAFARRPALAVSLKISTRGALPAMDHLKPYVTATSVRL